MKQKAIGGYFSLELPYNEYGEYHRDAIRLNSGRYCLEYVLRVKKYTKVYLPYYMCDAVLQPINKLGLDYQFYHIDKYFHIAEVLHPKKDEVILYCNYFGLMDEYVKIVTDRYAPNIIIDNTQAFFSRPLPEIDTFYTCRKFFGVADGAYLYTNKEADFDIPQDYSSSRMLFLLDRLDKSAEEAFSDYHKSEDTLDHDEIKKMSKITQFIMSSICYKSAADRRISNYIYLHDNLSSSNTLSVDLERKNVPMVYPFLSEDINLRKKLIDNKVYVASYWPNVQSWCNTESLENTLSQLLLPLPIDQRYSIDEMNFIVSVLKEFI
nr:hypothetical protein [uncultured Prevotella sp.]